MKEKIQKKQHIYKKISFEDFLTCLKCQYTTTIKLNLIYLLAEV